MSPQITAAIIAAGVGVLALMGTLAAQHLGRRDTRKALDEQRKQLDRTLSEQSARSLNERFATAAEQLGDDKPPAVRLAGVYAMAGLADDWEKNRQTCVDVLCGYLRMPYEPDPGQDAPESQRLAFGAGREVRHTVIRVITAHLKDDATQSWQGLNFDFGGAVFDGGDFRGAAFSGGIASFYRARFSSSTVRFEGAEFSGAEVHFEGAAFSGAEVHFDGARFSGGDVYFDGAQFSSGTVRFNGAQFSGAGVSFYRARFSGSEVYFSGALFSGGMVRFGVVEFLGHAPFYSGAEFSGGTVDFNDSWFSARMVDFRGVQFSGGTVDFTAPCDWSFPPAFDWTGTPPSGVMLPPNEESIAGVGLPDP